MRIFLTIIALVQFVIFPNLVSGQAKSFSIENSFYSITVDSQTGAIVGIMNKKTNTGYLSPKKKNNLPPFVIDTYSANQSVYIHDPFEKQDGGFSTFDPTKNNEKGDLSHKRESLSNTIKVLGDKNKISCSHQLSGGISVNWSVELKFDSPFSEWKIEVKNNGGDKPANDLRVYRVAFPYIEGLRIGEKPESNFLARPYAQGELIPNPSKYDYKRPGVDIPIHVLTYPGWASMSWQDMYDRILGGFYIASYDLTFNQVDLETWPDKLDNSITMGMRSLAFLEPGQSWNSQKFEVGIHEGDWHNAADHYREWAHANHKPFAGPDWVRKNADGWLGFALDTRSYSEYLDLFEKAKWLGLDYLQIWCQMQEHVGPGKTRKPFYSFLWPNPDRGGEEGLTKTVQKIREQGGHIGFYHNLWTWDSEIEKGMEQWKDQLPADIKVPKWRGESRTWASVFPDGSRMAGNFEKLPGMPMPEYSGMCPSAEKYQDYVLYWVGDKYVKQYGADTWYFDSTPVTMFAASRICFSDEHGEKRPHGAGQGMISLLNKLKEETASTVNLAITSETVCDALMQYNSHALGLELIEGITRYLKPEIYTYTFPEHAIFSGSCNGAGSGLHYYYPDLAGKPSKVDVYNRAFLMGYRFDILDRITPGDPTSEYLKNLIALRQRVKHLLYTSSFRDDIGLGKLPDKVYAKLFRSNDGKQLFVSMVDRREGKQLPFKMTIDLSLNEFQGNRSASILGFNNYKAKVPTKTSTHTIELQVPAISDKVALIQIGL